MWSTQASLNVMGFLDPLLSCYETLKAELPRGSGYQSSLCVITSAEIPLEHLELETL